MKILRIADVPDNRTGGMTRAMYGGGDVLCAMGHRVDYLFHDNFKVRPARLSRLIAPFHVPAMVRRLQRDRGRYDVVEIHEPSAAPYCFRHRHAADLPPVVLFSHGIEARARQQMNAYHRQKGLPITLPQRYFPWVVLQTNYAAHRADHIVCLNTLDQNYLIQRGVAPEAITRLLLGVEDEILHRPPALPQPTEVTEFLFFGTWVIRKGIRELIAAVTRLMDQRPSVRLSVAGFGVPPEVVRDSFPDRHRPRLNLLPKVVGSKAIAELYERHQVLILPSVFEGQPLVMLEAAALGLAIIATDESGMHDFFTTDRNGLLIPVGDENALAAALLRLADDPALTFRLGIAAREKAQQYTWSNSAQILLGAYEKAIERAKRGRAADQQNP